MNPDGTKSQYGNNIKSDGIAIFGVTKEINKNIKLLGWNMFTENVFNSTMIQTNIFIPIKKKSFLCCCTNNKAGRMNNEGNFDQAKTYFTKCSHFLSFGANFGWKNKQWGLSLNYNHITNNGRYLMPREWGGSRFLHYFHANEMKVWGM